MLIEKGNLYSSKWFEKANLEELETTRRLVQQDYNNPNLDYKNYCWNLLNRFDNAIGKIKWAGNRALKSLRNAQDSLNSAKNWGLWDMFGGGFISTMAKHSKMDSAKQNML